MMILAPFFTYYFLTDDNLNKGDYYEHLGLRWAGLLPASILPLILTITLFLGPLTMQFFSGIWKLYAGIVFTYYILCISKMYLHFWMHATAKTQFHFLQNQYIGYQAGKTLFG